MVKGAAAVAAFNAICYDSVILGLLSTRSGRADLREIYEKDGAPLGMSFPAYIAKNLAALGLLGAAKGAMVGAVAGAAMRPVAAQPISTEGTEKQPASAASI